jgi:hypothetical protein
MMKHLVTAADITTLTVVQVSVDDHKLEVAVPLAERRHLRPVLGSALFNELMLFVQDEPYDTDDALAKLANEIKPMLSNWAVVEAWPTLVASITNMGITFSNQREGGSSQVDYKTAGEIKASIQDTAEFETGELRMWLVEHAAEYPSYPQPAPAAPAVLIGGIQFS